MPKKLNKFLKSHFARISLRSVLFVVLIIVCGGALFTTFISSSEVVTKNRQIAEINNKDEQLKDELDNLNKKLIDLENEDQRKINKDLEEEIKNIQTTYKKTVSVYESLLDLKDVSKDTKKLDGLFAKSLSILSERNYASASAQLSQLAHDIESEKQKVTASFSIPASVPTSNTPPGAGYSRQQVQTDAGSFMVSIISADLGSTRVIVDTASASDCYDNCPVLPLGTYVSRNGAYAGVNGTYFCPASYPSCAGKTNSFDLLVMNKDKHYFNSDNNVYSNNPGVIFGGSYIRFVSSVTQWGRDSGIDSMLSNYPLLVEGGNIKVTGSDDAKMTSRGNRSFVANKGNTIFIGVAHNVTVAESAKVMKAMGMENALNLDSGGSTALWSGGYKVGPGRDIPNAVLFVKK